jgi:type II secretory pathway component PulK
MRARRERGSVLVVALVVMVAITFICLTLAREARVEIQVASRAADDVRTRAAADSCIDYAIAMVNQDTTADPTMSGTLQKEWRNDETMYRNFQLGPCHCWMYFGEPEDPGDGNTLLNNASCYGHFGIRDESSKLNLNVATYAQLMQVPGMTDDIADAIMCWRSTSTTDQSQTKNGAESDYYSTLSPPYNCKNSPFESIEELLCVRGIDESVLYGTDRNRNGILDPDENDGTASFPPDFSDGVLHYGFADYLTVVSQDLNYTKDGRQRMFVGQGTKATQQTVVQDLVQQGLSQQLATEVGNAIFPRPTGRGPPPPPFRTVGQLAAIRGITADQFAIVCDELTTVKTATIPGLVNVNTCPPSVLQGLGATSDGKGNITLLLTTDEVTKITNDRAQATYDMTTPAWLMNDLSTAHFAAIYDLITTRSYQFTVHAVAALDERPSVFRRIEAVIDRSYSPVQITFRRDLTPLGFPLPGERVSPNGGTPPP